MLNFSKKEQPKERIIPKTFFRSFEFMLNFEIFQFEIWQIIPFHLTGKLWLFESLTIFTSLLFEIKQIRGLHNF